MKKLISLALMVCLCLSLGVAANAEEGGAYVLMNIPYRDFYAAEGVAITELDAVTSATMAKTRVPEQVGGSYHVNADGSDVSGVIFPVYVEDPSVLTGLGGTEITDDSSVVITVTLKGQEKTTEYTGREALFEAPTMIREFSRDPDKMVIVVDPRLSETARMADMHIPVRTGSDSLFLRALIALILEKGWQDRDFLYRYCKDWAHARAWFLDFDIDGALQVCGVSREQAERFARILTTKKWGMHQDLGLYFGRQSTMSSYLCLVLMAVCGTLLVPGGNIPPVRIIQLGPTDEYDPKVWRMPVTGRFPVAGMYPEGALPDEVLGDNEDRIRMAFCNMSNPARSYPDSQKMEEALRHLELFVAMDCVETETTRLADYILPTPSAYEAGGDFDVFAFHYPEIMYFSRRAVVKAPGEAREDAMIYAELTEAMGLIPKLPQYLYDAAEEAVRTGDRIKYFMKVVGWIAKCGMKYFDQAAIIIALTLGKAMGSAGHAMCWAALLISKLPERAIMDVQPDTKQHPILARMPMLGEYCTMDAAFELVDKHPEGAVIAHSDTEHLMERHIKHKDKKFHLWCKEIDEAIKTITPEHERDALTLKGGCNMILSAGCHSDGGMNTSIVNNVETFAVIPEIVNKGADWFGSIGAEKFPGTKLMCLSGDVKNKVCVEVPTNATLRDVVESFGGGVTGGKKLKAVQLGGSSCGFVTPDQLDTPIDFDSIRAIGASLGSGAVYVIDETRNVVDILAEIARFFQHESCGKCTPCREGTMRIAELLEKLTKGEGTQKDIELIKTLSGYMQSTCFCPLGQSATTAFVSALKLFPEDFAAKLKLGGVRN